MIKTANLTGSVSRNAGGLYESVRRLVQTLQASGLQVKVFSLKDEHTEADISQWAPVPVRAFRPRYSGKFGYAPEFKGELEKFEPDITHTHGLWLYPSIVTNQSYRNRGVPYVISAHGMLDPWAIRNSRWKKVIAHFLYERAHLRDAACLRALCESEARAIRLLGLKNPIAIIPNGIDLPEIGNRKFTAVWPPSSGRKVLLFLSRIHPKKNLVNLLRAWAAVTRPLTSDFCPLSSEWRLAIAGWDQGGHEAELKQLATELGLPWADMREAQGTEGGKRESEIRGQSSNPRSPTSEINGQWSVAFLGPQFGENKAACYANCDAFILPSFSEGVPMVVLEAWAYGKPVLMTPECNLPIGFERHAAIRIETNPKSIAAGLQDLFRLDSGGAVSLTAARQPPTANSIASPFSDLRSPPSDLCSLGANGHRLAVEAFAWPVIAKNMKGLYEWILGGGPKPDCVTDY
jgi:glycosyltransferase involved in cell wall biosynthesis